MILLGIHTSILELIAIATFLFSIYYASTVNKLTWAIGLVSQICYFILFWNAELFANAWLQVFYCIICIYGWIYWKNTEHRITYLLWKQQLMILLPSVIFITLLSLVNPSGHAILDSTITVFSVVGTLLLSRKIIDSWYIWAIVDILGVYLFYKTGLILTAGCYVLAFINSLIAIYKWKRQV